MSAAVVHYVKNWDNNTKGYISFDGIADLSSAITETKISLIGDAIADGYADEDPAILFTITKAEIVDSVQAYAGHVSSL